MYENELQHHGVKGMKWGVRKATKNSQTTDLAQKKIALVKARKAYNKSYMKADTRRLQAFSLSKKRRQANSDRWDDVFKKAKELEIAKEEYRQARKKGSAAVGGALKTVGTRKVSDIK